MANSLHSDISSCLLPISFSMDSWFAEQHIMELQLYIILMHPNCYANIWNSRTFKVVWHRATSESCKIINTLYIWKYYTMNDMHMKGRKVLLTTVLVRSLSGRSFHTIVRISSWQLQLVRNLSCQFLTNWRCRFSWFRVLIAIDTMVGSDIRNISNPSIHLYQLNRNKVYRVLCTKFEVMQQEVMTNGWDESRG